MVKTKYKTQSPFALSVVPLARSRMGFLIYKNIEIKAVGNVNLKINLIKFFARPIRLRTETVLRSGRTGERNKHFGQL